MRLNCRAVRAGRHHDTMRITDTFDAATLLRDFDAITARIGV